MKVARLLVLGLCGAAVLALVGEGALSLFFGRSARALFEGPAEPAEALELEQEQAVAARATEGPLRLAEDPLVAYTLKLGSELSWADGSVEMTRRTDESGLAVSSRPDPAPEGAVRIAVLGDSVAFGYGLAEGDALAAQLERLLAAALPGRTVVCDTVAIPSWNTRNAWRFLFDHLDVLRPTIVLYLPVSNDVEDSFGVDEAGQRRVCADVAAPEPLLPVHSDFVATAMRLRRERARGRPEPDLGPEVLGSGLGLTSRTRLAEVARTIARGAERLARADVRLALAFYEESDYQCELLAELARQGADLPQIPLLDRVRDQDTLGVDPHPSAQTVAAFAGWTAQSLFELGWLPPEGRARLPLVAGRFAERRGHAVDADQALERSRARRAELEDELEPRIEPATMQGLLQIYGGLNPYSTIGPRCGAVLRRGRALRVQLAALDARPDLYPLEVRVVVDERPVGKVVVPVGGIVEERFELTGAVDAAFDVRLEPLDWAVITVRGRSWVAAAELRVLESLP